MRQSTVKLLGIMLLLCGIGLLCNARENDSLFFARKGLRLERHRGENSLGMLHEWITLSNSTGDVLRFTLLDVEGDSNSEALELGQTNLSGNKLVCYTSWVWAGDAPASPAGVRKSVYSIVEDGRIELETADIYIEVIRPGFIHREQAPEWLHGVRFLLEKSTNSADEQLFQTYVAAVEKAYGATFILGQLGAKLERQVQAAMRETIQQYTADWESVFGESPFGTSIEVKTK